ncbi:hypothetical protein [uncultured Chryseobacterium sp.]|uniref:hypothetical protein n=1 Tax=uncultured Chryseobacterium sp. TaxID=259322 RepID=UPI003747CB88
MGENNNKQSDFSYQIIDVLPQYTTVNTIYQEILKTSTLNFDEQCQITDFYTWIKNRENFEKAVLNFILSTDKEKQLSIVSILRKLIKRNIEIYKSNQIFFDGLDTISVCANRPDSLNYQINIQQSQTNTLWMELVQVKNSLESASWNRENAKVEYLTGEEERVSNLYKIEQDKLAVLYKQKAESDMVASKYIKNVFRNIYESGIFNISILNNYFPIETKRQDPNQSNPQLQEGKYFPMEIVSKIHKECNGFQFESLAEVELYSILNLLPVNTQMVIKKGEKIRICYLISVLYDYLKVDDKIEWRSSILKSLDIKEDFYNSKYKEPVSEVPSKESKNFALSISKIFV